MKKVILGLMLFSGIVSVSAQTKTKTAVTTAKAKTEKAADAKTTDAKATATSTANATKENARGSNLLEIPPIQHFILLARVRPLP